MLFAKFIAVVVCACLCVSLSQAQEGGIAISENLPAYSDRDGLPELDGNLIRSTFQSSTFSSAASSISINFQLRMATTALPYTSVNSFSTDLLEPLTGEALGLGTLSALTSGNFSALFNAYRSRHPDADYMIAWIQPTRSSGQALFADSNSTPDLPLMLLPYEGCGSSVDVNLRVFGWPYVGSGVVGIKLLGTVQAYQVCISAQVKEGIAGHTWLRLDEGSLSTSSIYAGLYPGDWWSLLSFASVPGQVIDIDSLNPCAQTACYTITAQQYLTLKDKVAADKANPPRYGAFNNNCTTYVVDSLQSAGIDINLNARNIFGIADPVPLVNSLRTSPTSGVGVDLCRRVSNCAPFSPNDDCFPVNFSVELLVDALLTDPIRVAQDLGVPYRLMPEVVTEVAPGGALSVRIGGAQPRSHGLFVRWTDQASDSFAPATLTHVVGSNGEQVSLAVVCDAGGIHIWPLRIQVVPRGATQRILDIVPSLLPAFDPGFNTAVPVITQQPGPLTTCAGGTGIFTITAAGTAPFVYQWRKDGALISAAGNPSATTATLAIPNMQDSDAGSYECVVTNSCGMTISAPSSLTITNNPIWSSLRTGLSGLVGALAVLPNGDVVAGGQFTFAAGLAANNIAKWTPASGQWSSLGSGTDGYVDKLIVMPNGDIVAGGNFTVAGGVSALRVARWNGSEWRPLGSGLPNVYSLAALPNGDLVASGSFSSLGGRPARNIARWDGTAWFSLGGGIDFQANALAVTPNGSLAASGVFGVTRWNGSQWSPLASHPGFAPWEMVAMPNGDLVVGGDELVGNYRVGHVSRWNGTVWTPLAADVTGRYGYSSIFSLAVAPNGDLLAGGIFDSIGGVPVNNVARWNGSTWSAFGSGCSEAPAAVAVLPSGDVIIGGQFGSAGGTIGTSYIARWNGTAWSALRSAISNPVYKVLTLPNGEVAVGGNFTSVAGRNANYIARWNPTSEAWSTFGSGVSAWVYALAMLPNGDLVAGGDFNFAEGVSANSVARWNGTAWSPFGSGLIGHVYELLVLPNGDLIAGGGFSIAGSAVATNIARWNGTSWSALGTGMNDAVIALTAMPNGDIVAGGTFTIAGGVNTNYVARWDGVAWHALSTGMNNPVYELLVMPDGNLVAGGFNTTSAGGVEANNIAKWDGAGWSAMGLGMNGSVRSLTVLPNGYLAAAGGFTTAGDTNASRIAVWNGLAWSPLGTGVNNTINSLAVLPDGDLAAGGFFTTAGGLESAYFARYSFAGPPIITHQPTPTSVCNDDSATFAITATQTGISYQWRKNAIPIDVTLNPSATTPMLLIAFVQPTDGGWYDCIVTNACGNIASDLATLTVEDCTACAADFNQDGGIDGADVDAFFASWVNADASADVNQDGGVDGADVDTFFVAWAAGGC